jgi:hypothetical protein
VCRRLDALLVVVVLLFAFLVASFPVYTSDFFRQLATGRLLAQGAYPFGADPFCWSTDGVYWANHSWLFGLVVYGLYQIPQVGGAAVVVFKALLVTALAAALVAAGRRPGQRLWAPAACAGLALLALSARLYLQPACFSYLFLGLTLWLLRRPRLLRQGRAAAGLGPAAEPRDLRSFWLLPVLFALWVNLDVWFLLGPLVAALYLAGEVLGAALGAPAEGADAPAPGEMRTLGIALLVGVAACLVNPFGYHAFVLPEGLGLGAGVEPTLRDSQSVVGPLQSVYFLPTVGLSAAGLAYFPLLLLGVVSFVLLALGPGGPRVLAGWRLLVWLPFALFSLVNVRGVSFFAVVAGPVTALNLLDLAARLGPVEVSPTWRGIALAGRALTLLLGLAALVATVPGWLQAQPYAPRRVAWEVVPDPSLEQATRQILAWREQGRVPPGTHWFNLTPDVANYLAWYAPGERSFLDQRAGLFAAAAPDFVAVRRALAGGNAPSDAEADNAEAGAEPAWRGVFRDRGTDFLIIDTAQGQRSFVLTLRLFASSEEWAACYADGRTAVFRWKDPARRQEPDPYAALYVDFKRRAFGPDAEKAPDRGPEHDPAPSPWWAALWTPPPPRDVDSDAVILHYARYEALAPRYLNRNGLAWEMAVAAGLTGCGAAPGGPVLNGLLLPLRVSFTYRGLHGQPIQPPGQNLQSMDLLARRLYEAHVAGQESGPPDSLYLAIRAARRSLAANPDQAYTQLSLGRAYLTVWLRTRENFLTNDLPAFATIRRTQIAAVLNNCLKLNPPPAVAQEAHEILAFIHSNPHTGRPYLDLVAKHRRGQLEAIREVGPLPQESAKDFAQRLEKLEKDVGNLEREVQRRSDQYEVNAANKPLVQRAQAALENGLAGKALDVFKGITDPLELLDPARGGGAQAVALTVELLLTTGQLEDARDLLDPDRSGPAGTQNTPGQMLLQVRRAAAAGDYAEADGYLAAALQPGEDPARRQTPVEATGPVVAQYVGHLLLREAPQAAGLPWQIDRHLPLLFARPGQVQWVQLYNWQTLAGLAGQTASFWTQREAELRLLRGWLALEAGRVAEADEQFRALEPLVAPPRPWMPRPFEGMRDLTARYRRWIATAR